MPSVSEPMPLVDGEPSDAVFRADVMNGLRRRPKCLPCKYFYDEKGSELFDRICELDAYYLTRTELAIMRRFAPEMARQIGSGAMLVELGSGSSVKSRLLLDRLTAPAAYVPVDISKEHLDRTARGLALDYRHLEILPVCADFTEDFELPAPRRRPTRTTVYFPGSSIGNFEPEAARHLLGRIAGMCGRGGGLLIGIDLKKDRATIEAAYDDAGGVTAAFNLNLLRRINRTLGADFRLDRFEHRAVYNEELGRVEIGLVSRCVQTVTIEGKTFEFDRGEEIRTEHCHKYSIEGFAERAAHVGLSLRCRWTDAQSRLAVLYLTAL